MLYIVYDIFDINTSKNETVIIYNIGVKWSTVDNIDTTIMNCMRCYVTNNKIIITILFMSYGIIVNL